MVNLRLQKIRYYVKKLCFYVILSHKERKICTYVKKQNKTMKIILNILAFTCVGLASLGMFLPVLPTTPFLLLASWLFLKANSGWRDWLLNHKVFGPYIQNFLIHRAIPLRAKIASISTLWATILLSVYIVNPIWLKILLIFIAICVTIHLLSFKTLQK